jgi:hypothetical protein
MGPAVDSRIKTPDAGIPLLQSESEVRAAEHSSSADQLSNVMLISPFSVLEINELQTLSSFHVLPQHTFETSLVSLLQICLGFGNVGCRYT